MPGLRIWDREQQEQADHDALDSGYLAGKSRSRNGNGGRRSDIEEAEEEVVSG